MAKERPQSYYVPKPGLSRVKFELYVGFILVRSTYVQ